MQIAIDEARQLQKAVRTVKKILGGVVVGELPRRKNVPLSRVNDAGVKVVCRCGRAYGPLLGSCPRCGGDKRIGFLSW